MKFTMHRHIYHLLGIGFIGSVLTLHTPVYALNQNISEVSFAVPSQNVSQRWVFRSQKALSAIEVIRTKQNLEQRLQWLTGKSWPLSVSPTRQGQFLFSFIGSSNTLSDFQVRTLTHSTSLQWKIKESNSLWVDRMLDSQYLEQVDAQYVEDQWQVRLKYQGLGARQLAELTRQAVSQTVGIFVGERLISSPIIQTPILQGEAIITGQFSADEVEQIVQDIRWAVAGVGLDFVGTATVY